MEEHLHFKIDWASLMVGIKFSVFALFYFVFEGNFQVQAPGGLIFEGAIHGGSFALLVWRAYIWRGLCMEGLIFGILWYLPKPKAEVIMILSCSPLTTSTSSNNCPSEWIMHELGLLPICFKKNLLKLDKILDLLAVFKVKIFNISLFHTKDFQENIWRGASPKEKE